MDIDVRRYDRQIALPHIDLLGQERLAAAHILIIGMGGLGCAAAQSLTLMGVGKLTIVDNDTVELTNLARQALYRERDIGKPKVNSAVDALQKLNPNCDVKALEQTFNENSLSNIASNTAEITLVLDCTDNLATRLTINKACRQHEIPLITAAAIRFEGMLCCVHPAPNTPCYECLAKVWPDPNESCVERGIFSPVVNIIGTYQAMLAGKYVLGLPAMKSGEVQFFDGLNNSWRSLNFALSPSCSVCSMSSVKQHETKSE